MRRLVAFWVAVWTLLGIGFWQADKRGFALCKAVRFVFGTQTTAGKVRLGAALAAGNVALYRHLVKPGT